MQKQRLLYRSRQIEEAKEKFLIIRREVKLKSKETLRSADGQSGLYSTKSDASISVVNLTKILSSRRGFGVSNPHDMVFAHLGLVAKAAGIEVNYDQPTAKIYNDLAKRHIEATMTPELLSKIEDRDLNKRLPGLASWAPDWTYSFPPYRTKILAFLREIQNDSCSQRLGP